MENFINSKYSDRKFITMFFFALIVFLGLIFSDKITELPAFGFMGTLIGYYMKKNVDEKRMNNETTVGIGGSKVPLKNYFKDGIK